MNFHQSTIKHVNRIEINVADIKRQTDFYHHILGLKVMTSTSTQTVLAVGEDGHEVVLKQLDNGRFASKTEAGLFHIAFLLSDVTQLGALIKHLSDEKVPIAGGDHLVSEAIYFNDLEGNGIEVYIDRPSESWQWQNELVVMDTLQLDVPRILAEAGETKWEDMPAKAKIGHLHLKTHDLSASSEFYLQLGFQIASALFLSDQKYHHHLAINTWQSNQPLKDAENTYGLTAFNIVDANKNIEKHKTPEGLNLTINQSKN
ncbi:VOC family protein [Staphylococcus simulans]|uniref:VOC family protein n=1 Tax=Staphylococcus simulans TaxID=1286 RepID=UPI00399B57EF